MKRYSTSIIACILLLLSAGVQAQMYILNEDFSTTTGTTPPANWSNTIVTGQATDLWHFDNPASRTINYPITAPFAIFDASNYSGGGGPEKVNLETPYFDASVGSHCLLFFDQFMNLVSGDTCRIIAFDGTNWVKVQDYTATSPANPQHIVLDLSAICAGKTDECRSRRKLNTQGICPLNTQNFAK